MDAAQSTLYLQEKRIQTQKASEMADHPASRLDKQQRASAASSSSRNAAAADHPEGDADVDVGLNQWAGASRSREGEPSADQVASAVVEAVGEEEDEEEDSEVLEEEAHAYGEQGEWDPSEHAAEGVNLAGEDEIEGEEVEHAEEEQEEEEEEKSEDAYDDYEEMLDSDTPTETITWIKWFCSLPGHEFFAEVDEDFIEDDFNLTGLNAVVPFYKEALEMILDAETVDDSHKIPDVAIIESSAELLYGLIHQRYINTRRGLAQMLEKYESHHFGACPRVFCHLQTVLPCGRSDLPGLETVKLYCPNCMDNYQPPSSRFAGVDGAYFGTTFPHLFLQNYRDLEPSPIAVPSGSSRNQSNNAAAAAADTSGANPSSQSSSASTGENSAVSAAAAALQAPPGAILDANLVGQKVPQSRIYTPRIYGFKVSEHAKSGPRMRWLRMRPTNLTDLEYEGMGPPASSSTSTAAPAAGASNSRGSKAATRLTSPPAADGTGLAVNSADRKRAPG